MHRRLGCAPLEQPSSRLLADAGWASAGLWPEPLRVASACGLSSGWFGLRRSMAAGFPEGVSRRKCTQSLSVVLSLLIEGSQRSAHVQREGLSTSHLNRSLKSML